ncbi:hypothetical protein PtB15_18B183 [Puccinia triticina]|nr:hypothetical protein PtB15_18B183 [Puccinia triticina]
MPGATNREVCAASVANELRVKLSGTSVWTSDLQSTLKPALPTGTGILMNKNKKGLWISPENAARMRAV